jgi:hypothetical protein
MCETKRLPVKRNEDRRIVTLNHKQQPANE